MVDLRGVNDRDIYESIINRTFDINVLDAFARKKIEQLDKRHTAHRKRVEKKREQIVEFGDQVLSVLDENPMSRQDIAYAVTDDYGYPEGEITVNKVGYWLNIFAKDPTTGVLRQEAEYNDEETGELKHIIVYSRYK